MKKNKINILHIITGLGKGGAERVVFDLCKNINTHEFNVSVFAFGNKDDLLPFFEGEKIDVTFRKINKFYKIFHLVFDLKKISKEKKIDLIHAHLYHAFVISFLLNVFSFFKFKIVFTAHTLNLQSTFREFVLWLLKPFRSVDIFFSNRKKKYYENDTIEVIPNGIDTSSYDLKASKKNDLFIFLSIGRLEYVKNHIGLIKAIKSIKTQIQFEVWIIGEGHLHFSIQQIINDENLEKIIKLKGYRTDIVELCSLSHCFLMHSLWEGLPIALIEAGASGLPVISTPVGSIPDLINEENGYLAKIDNFGDMMTHVLSNYDEAKRKGETLKKLIQSKYDIKSVVLKHEQLYKKMISN